MKFNNLCKKTMESLKEATLSFWIMCLIVFLLTICHEGISTHLTFTPDSILSSLGEEMEFGEIDVDDYEEITDSSNSELDEEENSVEVGDVVDGVLAITSDLEYLKDAKWWLLEKVIFVVLIPIIYYYVIAFAIESVEKQPIVKGKNLAKMILAQLVFTLMAIIPALCSIALIVFGVLKEFIILCVLGALMIVVGFIYLSVRYTSIYYISIKYQSYSIKEIISQSAQLIKGDILKVMLYRVDIWVTMLGFSMLLTMIMVLLMMVLPVGVYISLICSSIVNVLYIAISTMFNVNMFKELEA